MFQYNATVYNVIDGDTIDVNVDLGFKVFTKQRLRLGGIDTPERGQPGFKEAGDKLRELILNKEVKIITYKQSKWGYFLADIYINDEYINSRMIAEGFAKHYTGGTKE